MKLPTGYPHVMNGREVGGKETFPAYDSDYVTLEKHGIREVMKNLKNQWSSPKDPYSKPESYYNYIGSNGILAAQPRTRVFENASARCIDDSNVKK